MWLREAIFLAKEDCYVIFAPSKKAEAFRILSVSGCSSVGRVHVWGACGRTFESCHPDDNEGRLLGNREPFFDYELQITNDGEGRIVV